MAEDEEIRYKIKTVVFGEKTLPGEGMGRSKELIGMSVGKYQSEDTMFNLVGIAPAKKFEKIQEKYTKGAKYVAINANRPKPGEKPTLSEANKAQIKSLVEKGIPVSVYGKNTNCVALIKDLKLPGNTPIAKNLKESIKLLKKVAPYR
jgi:hypothetical protein